MRRRGLAGGIRWFAAGTGLILVLLLAGRAAGTAAENLDRDACRRAVETGGRWLVDYVWHQAGRGAGERVGAPETDGRPAIRTRPTGSMRR